MKKLCLSMLCLACLLLSACGTRAEEKKFEDFSKALSERDDLSFIGSIRAEYDDRSLEFQLQYKEEDYPVVSVIRPELIADVKIRIEPDSSLLEHNSLIIDTGELDSRGLSPVTALPRLAAALRSAYVDAVRMEGGELVYTLIPDDELTVEVWFEPESMTPTHAELISESKVRIFCDIESWR